MLITIREALPADAETIAAGNSAMAQETEGRPLAADVIAAGVTTLITDPARGRYWVAMAGERIVGQIMVTYEWSDWRNGAMWWIQSVYVPPDSRRQGVFSALYRHVESLARADDDACGLRLYVEKNNLPAQGTYLALGMVDPGYRVMEVDFRKERQAVDSRQGEPGC